MPGNKPSSDSHGGIILKFPGGLTWLAMSMVMFCRSRKRIWTPTAGMAQKAGKIWGERGALDYNECAGNDLDVKMEGYVPTSVQVKPGETVVFAYIVSKSR
jgi:hypothetical protein